MEHQPEVTDEFVQKAVATGKQYCAYLYRVGPNRDQPAEELEKIQADHLRYLFQLRAEGKLVIDGSVTDDSELENIGIFSVTDTEEVRRLLEGDPAFQAGRVTYEIHPWFGIPGDCLP